MLICISRDKQKLRLFHIHELKKNFGAQKSHLNEKEMVLLSDHNIYFGCEIRKSRFNYSLLFGGLNIYIQPCS